MNYKMNYRTKAAMKLLMELTREEALNLSDILDRVQKKLYIGNRIFPFDCMKKEDAVISMKETLEDESLGIPGHLRGHLERFLELMITERAPMDRLSSEYNSAFVPVMHYELFRPDTPGGDGLKDSEMLDVASQAEEGAREHCAKDVKEAAVLTQEIFEGLMRKWIHGHHRAAFATDIASDKGQAKGLGPDGELAAMLRGIRDILERMEGALSSTTLKPGMVVNFTQTYPPGITKEDAQAFCELSQERFDQMIQDHEKRKVRKGYVGGMGGGVPGIEISIPCPPKRFNT